MSKHLQICHLGLILILAWGGLSSTALAQTKLPPDVVTAANASGRKAEIEAFVRQHVSNLKGGADMPKSRDALAQQVANPSNVPSASFLDLYATALGNEIASQGLDKSQDVRVRLNAAIVVCNVASHANNSKLAAVTLTFVKDSAEPVALWGLKSAKAVIPSMILEGQKTQPMSSAVLDAVKRFPDSDFVPEDAYKALMLDTTSDKRVAAMAAPMIRSYVAEPMALFEYRIGLYQAAPPKRPEMDVLATVFFVNKVIWEAMSNQQQAKAVNLTLALANGANNGTPELVDIIKNCGVAISIVGLRINDTQIQTTATTLSKVGNNVPQDNLKDQIKALDTLVKAKFPSPSTALNMNRP